MDLCLERRYNIALSLHILIMRQFGRYCLNNQPSVTQERAFGTVSGQILTHYSKSLHCGYSCLATFRRWRFHHFFHSSLKSWGFTLVVPEHKIFRRQQDQKNSFGIYTELIPMNPCKILIVFYCKVHNKTRFQTYDHVPSLMYCLFLHIVLRAKDKETKFIIR